MMALDEENRCNVRYMGKYNILPRMLVTDTTTFNWIGKSS
jgi:hypothetical protein